MDAGGPMTADGDRTRMVNWSTIVSELPDSITTPNFTFVNEGAYVNPEPLIVTMSPPAMLPLEGLMFDNAGDPNGLTVIVVVSVASLFSLSLTVNVTTCSPTGNVILGFGPDPTTVLPSFQVHLTTSNPVPGE